MITRQLPLVLMFAAFATACVAESGPVRAPSPVNVSVAVLPGEGCASTAPAWYAGVAPQPLPAPPAVWLPPPARPPLPPIAVHPPRAARPPIAAQPLHVATLPPAQARPPALPRSGGPVAQGQVAIPRPLSFAAVPRMPTSPGGRVTSPSAPPPARADGASPPVQATPPMQRTNRLPPWPAPPPVTLRARG